MNRMEETKMKKGLMIVVSGPAGSGKGTVNAHLLQTGEFVYSVSATTRAPRPGEIDGVNYHYITREEFLARIVDVSNGRTNGTVLGQEYRAFPVKEPKMPEE